MIYLKGVTQSEEPVGLQFVIYGVKGFPCIPQRIDRIVQGFLFVAPQSKVQPYPDALP